MDDITEFCTQKIFDEGKKPSFGYKEVDFHNVYHVVIHAWGKVIEKHKEIFVGIEFFNERNEKIISICVQEDIPLIHNIFNIDINEELFGK